MAYFPVSLYIPSYSTAIGLSVVNGTIALATFNIARVVGMCISFALGLCQIHVASDDAT